MDFEGVPRQCYHKNSATSGSKLIDPDQPYGDNPSLSHCRSLI